MMIRCIVTLTSSFSEFKSTDQFVQLFVHVRLKVDRSIHRHRDSFQKYLFFFSRSNLFIIFQEGPFVRRTDMNFPGIVYIIIMFFKQTQFLQDCRRTSYRKDMFFQRGSICSSNRPYLIEQIIFPETLI